MEAIASAQRWRRAVSLAVSRARSSRPGSEPSRSAVAEEARAEAVEGGDVGALDQRELAEEAGVVFGVLFVEFLAEDFFDAALHLGGGGLGEGHDEELVDVARGGGVDDEVGAAGGE